MKLNPEFVSTKFLATIGEKLSGRRPAAEARLDHVIELCRNGNPFPLIAAQWPFLVIDDPDEAKFFEGDVDDPENPCVRLDNWQRQVIQAFFDDSVREILIKGNTKAGKGACTSIAINCWFFVWEETKVVLTSQRWDHAAQVIFSEVSKWRKKMTTPGIGTLLSAGISATDQKYITIANPASGEGFSGQHSERTLFVMDESTAIDDGRFDDAQKQARKIVALANPRTLSGWFRRCYDPCDDPDRTQVVRGPFGLRLCVTVSGKDCMNVRNKRLERPFGPPGGIDIGENHYDEGDDITPDDFEKVGLLIPAQCDYARFLGICQHPDPRHVDVFGLGKFPTEDEESQVIMWSWLHDHIEHWRNNRERYDVTCFGLDVARSLGGDSTVLAAGGSQGCVDLDSWEYADIAATVNRVIDIAAKKYGIDLTLGQNPVCVDMDGLGSGAGDMLREKGVWVIEFRGNGTAKVDARRFANSRTEAYALLGERLNPDGRFKGQYWGLPASSRMHEELIAPEKVYGGDALRFHISPKRKNPSKPTGSSVEEKLGRSPDEGDSVVYLFEAVREYHHLNEWFRNVAGRKMVTSAPEYEDSLSEKPLAEWLADQYGESSNPYAPRSSAKPPETPQSDETPAIDVTDTRTRLLRDLFND